MRHLLMLSTLLAVTTSALAQEPLTIYTYDSFASDWGPGPKIKQAFEKECGCQIDFVPLEDGVAILNGDDALLEGVRRMQGLFS